MPAVNIRDLNNAKEDVDHIAEVATSFQPTATDRFGKTKKTVAGVLADAEASASAMLASLGYQPPVPYSAGINLNEPTQTVEHDGQTYAPIIEFLPFTTSGTFEAEKFRLIQGVSSVDLASTAPGKGAAMLGRGVMAVDSITDLLTLPPGERRGDLRYLVTSYYGGWAGTTAGPMGGGELCWLNDSTKTADNCVVFAPPGVAVGRFHRVITAPLDVSCAGTVPGGPDCTDAFNALYAASENLGFECSGYRGFAYHVGGEVRIGGAVVRGGRTDMVLTSSAARLRIEAKSQASNFAITCLGGFSGSAVYLNGLDDWGTQFQHNVFSDFYIECLTSTGNAVHLDCSEPSSRIAYLRSSGVRIMGFEKGLYLHAGTPTGGAFINANSFIDYMGGGFCKSFIYMHADKALNPNNDIDSNKLISFDFQEKGNDNALVMIGCELNQLIGHTYFDLVKPGSVYVSADSKNNLIQGAWLQPFEDISPDNIVINGNNSNTYKSYIQGRAIHAQTFGYRQRLTLPENAEDVTINTGGFWQTNNTSATTYARFRGLRNGEILDILCADEFSWVTNTDYVSVPGYGVNTYKLQKDAVYRFRMIDGVAVMDPPVPPRIFEASTSITTGTQVYGWSNIEPLGRNDSWILVVGNNGQRYRVPAWSVS